MRYWIVFLLLITASASSDITLYDALKTNLSVKNQFVATYDFPAGNTLSDDVNHYQINEQLSKPFQAMNHEDNNDYLPLSINVNEVIPYPYKKLIEDSVYLQLLMLSSIGVLAILPEDISHWDASKLQEKSLSQRWNEHVSAGPVWDDDDLLINYIGHPVSGAFYYTMARNDGMSISESAAFSTLMSTFFWEYGYEAFSEVPSIQDLIITPLFGSILGEGMMVLQAKLDKNDGLVFGSKTLGNISYFWLDPIGNIAYEMKNILKSFNIDLNVTMTLQTYPKSNSMLPSYVITPKEDSIRMKEREYGFIITFQ